MIVPGQLGLFGKIVKVQVPLLVPTFGICTNRVFQKKLGNSHLDFMQTYEPLKKAIQTKKDLTLIAYLWPKW